MKETKLLEEFKAHFPEAEVKIEREKRISVEVSKGKLIEAAFFARDKLGFDYPLSVAGVDLIKEGYFLVVYHVLSTADGIVLSLKTRVQRDNPSLPSLIKVWEGVNWHERETWELLGIVFEGHPNLAYLLLPEDWNEGFPLRKDFEVKEDE